MSGAYQPGFPFRAASKVRMIGKYASNPEQRGSGEDERHRLARMSDSTADRVARYNSNEDCRRRTLQGETECERGADLDSDVEHRRHSMQHEIPVGREAGLEEDAERHGQGGWMQLFQGYPNTVRNLIAINSSASGELKRLQRNLHQSARKLAPLLRCLLRAHSGPWAYCSRIHDQIYHCVRRFHLEEGQLRQYGEIYILDCSEAAQGRLSYVQNRGCDAGLMMTLSRLILEINPYAQSFTMMHEGKMAEEVRSRTER
ncbi:unnamed protein product [Heligmosomoides polygyrus]|uniref:Helitron_like_N domain-containing protein n=1 Tax=Heligmosomoides polygyrus TaxID=6339 RepID=A0A183GEV8_HELPZ|nr:unnamed protein product [Heligmosomoides polygyrus]